jgi:hypothetical protein
METNLKCFKNVSLVFTLTLYILHETNARGTERDFVYPSVYPHDLSRKALDRFG